MPRKQTRQPSRKRLWFNVVEFDKETGRPLWRNKKTKLENDLPPCITDPTFTAMLDKLREETELALNMQNPSETSQLPCSMVWRNNKSTFSGSKPAKPTPTQQHFYRNTPPNSPKLVMQFQHFSPLTSANDNLDVQQHKQQIHDFLKMKPVQYGRDYQGLPDFEDSKRTRTCYTNSEAYVPDSDVLSSDWDSTVRLHHMDFDNKNCMYENNFNSDQKVPLAIF